MSFPASSTMVPAVEEVQNGKIQRREILQTDIQEVYMMVLLHMQIKAHLYTVYNKYSVTPSTICVCFFICMGMYNLITGIIWTPCIYTKIYVMV